MRRFRRVLEVAPSDYFAQHHNTESADHPTNPQQIVDRKGDALHPGYVGLRL